MNLLSRARRLLRYRFIASLFFRRKRVGVATVLVTVMLAVGLPLQLILLKGTEVSFYVFDFPTVAFLIATLILVGLNYRNIKHDALKPELTA